MLNTIQNNQLLSGIIVGLILLIVGWAVKYFRDMRDSGKIYFSLKKSDREGKYTFRSTEAISSNTGIEETRVAKLCSRDCRFKRNSKEKQSWRLVK